ncbi:MFS general substrate transporter [Lentithecium fluviatile CBS 122367]|uniref:MFS general substrate transporter n=1 Tax=Lentithecium fluviatile CBS 122367 TaxID=1168545 RepID=A0A6G1J4X4_9PLEO|nr:MFS general substrate transporter [Lentithecium fluviatile CBS 122367]
MEKSTSSPDASDQEWAAVAPLEVEVEEPKEEIYPSGPRLWIMVFSLVISIFLISLDMTIVATAIPAITDEFQGIKDVVWYGAIFFMTAAGFQSTWGKIYKYFPLKISFLVAIAIFEVGSVLCAAAPTSEAFIIGRAIAGMGAAGVGCGCYTMIGFMAEPRKRAAYTGLLGAIYGVGSVLGPLLGGVFSGDVTWRWCFYINLPIGVVPVGTIIFFFRTPATAKPQEATLREKLLQMDLLGTTLLMGATVSYILAVHYGGQVHPWSSSIVIGLLVGSGLQIITFGLNEWWQGERAIIIPRLFMRRELGISAVYTVLQAGGFFVMIYYMPIYFQASRGSTPIMSGVQNLPFILGAAAGAFGAGLVISATGLAIVVMVVGAAIGILGSGLCYMFDENTSIGTWIGFQLISGFGLGAAFQIPVMVGQSTVEPIDLSSATSMMLCFQTLGGALWLSAAQSVFVNRLIVTMPKVAPKINPLSVVATGAGKIREVFSPEDVVGIVAAYIDGIRGAFVLACIVTGLAMLLAFCLPWKKLDLAAVAKAGGAA